MPADRRRWRLVREWPGEFHVGVWITRRAFSLRFGKLALIYDRYPHA
jgi:hypothetical protein